ncbi:RNA polymerase sigma factor [Salinibacter altiplanensis]|uniref:RNA polymerase sigma factor n=1 Tax=Salinibacter altiplanensis TaxID=1803181 RepID=UPI000C9EF7CD|nr:RNA polymerase sigma-70 factor [Salinibacter altiplanensis]
MDDAAAHDSSRESSLQRDVASTEPSLDALCTRLANGDAEAFETIFRRLSEPIFRYVCGMVSDESLAHDLTQDTFAKLWTARDRMTSVGSLRAYVFRMARNRVYNQQRDAQTRRKNRDQLRKAPPHGSPPAPDRALDANLLRDRLREWIDELPNRQREALTLRRQQDLSHDTIADLMDIAPSTVNNHITRALKHLRERLREHRSDPHS